MQISSQDSALARVVAKVSRSMRPLTIRNGRGDAVKVIPVPKPIRHWKGRPVYRIEDAKYLYLDCPWLLE